MFGNFVSTTGNKNIDRVEYEEQNDSRYKSAISDNVIYIDTALGRVYVNSDSYFASVPESVWDASFAGELPPKEMLEIKIGASLSEEDILSFQRLLSDLVDAEFNTKSRLQS